MGEKEMNRRSGCGARTYSTNVSPTSRGFQHAAMNRHSGGAPCDCRKGNEQVRRTGCMNGNGGGGATNEKNASEGVLCCGLMEQLRKLEFAIVDVALYLDAYPESESALAYYHKLIEERDCLYERINESCGPMTLYDNKSKTVWSWTDGPWPWHTNGY